MKVLATLLFLGAGAGLAGCVPFAGDYSDFAVRGKGGAAPAAAGGPVAYAEGVYRGGLAGGYPQGEGSFAYHDGRRYEGGFAAGRAEGRGRMTYPDGRVVTGEYRQGRERDVEIAYGDGRRYSGEVRRGRAAGAGTLVLPTGEQLSGRFQNDQAEGFGQLTGRDGQPVYTGGFRQGRMHGEGWCGAGASADVCIKDQGQDITAAQQQQRAAAAVKRQIEDEAAREQEAVRQELSPQLKDSEARLRTAERTLQGWQGPQSGEECYCELTGYCLLVESADTTPEQRRLDDIAWERRKAECRVRYGAYLGSRGQADYRERIAQLDAEARQVRAHYAALRAEDQRRRDAIEATRQQRLRDEEQQKRLVRAQLEQDQREREARREKLRQQCQDPGYARGHPCGCGVVSSTPPVKGKGRACEA